VKTILLVTESKVTQELVKVYLVAKDVRILEAFDGVEALSTARLEHPDLVLCDLRVQRLDGPGLCRELRSEPALQSTPVIILSSENDGETLRTCREAGARAVIQKPVRPHDLHDAVRRHSGIAVGLAYPRPPNLDRGS